MSPENAIQVVKQVTSLASMSLQDHINTQEAIKVLEGMVAANDNPKNKGKKNDTKEVDTGSNY